MSLADRLRSASPPGSGENPVCPSCGTVYRRSEVIRLLREQSPFLFDSAVWATRFKCVKCGEEIGIAGHRGE